MANGYFERGEVYGIRMDSGFGSEQGYYRPGVIVSCNRGNNSSPTVNVAFTTTKLKDMGVNVETMATGKQSWVLCNQLATVDKNRFGVCMGRLTIHEMQAVDDALAEVLDLDCTNNDVIAEKEQEIAVLEAEKADLRAEVARLKAEIEAKNDDNTSREVEVAMWQRLYEKALNTVVEMKFGSDVTIRAKKPVDKPEHKNPDEPPKVDEPKKLDVNSCTFSELREIGVSDNIALLMVNRRPFESLDEVKKLPGLTNVAWAILSKKICVVKMEKPEEPEKPEKKKVEWDGVKVNVNTVGTATELHRRTGINMRSASEIVRHREQFGDYEKIGDLTNLKSFGDVAMKRYGHMLEV